MTVSRISGSNPTTAAVSAPPPSSLGGVERPTARRAQADGFDAGPRTQRQPLVLDSARPLAAVDLSRPSGMGLDIPQVDLSRGYMGDVVRQLQECLVALGHMTQAQMDTGPGTFGPMTEAAVKSFQAAAGVQPVSGHFGPLTRAAMERAACRRWRSRRCRAGRPARSPARPC